jgi:hypothetical protein
VERKHWWIVALVVAMAAPVRVVAAEGLPLVVYVDDRTGGRAEDMANAKGEVERIFADAGVSIRWKEGRVPASVMACCLAA